MVAALHVGRHTAEIINLPHAGADVNKQSKYGKTALMFAASYGCRKEIINLPSLAGADVNKQKRDGRTALMSAVRCRVEHAAKMINLLLDAGADVNTQDMDGMTALMFAASYGYGYRKEIINLLVNAGADMEKQDEDGKTALMWAAQFGGEYAAMVRFLVIAGGAIIPPVSRVTRRYTTRTCTIHQQCPKLDSTPSVQLMHVILMLSSNVCLRECALTL